MGNSPWLIRKRREGRPSFRLYCFSYAGGNASHYQAWQSGLDPRIEVCAVQLPGRGGRFRESLPSTWSGIIEPVAEAIRAEQEVPFALFGHSFGALLAFEVARYCVRNEFAYPAHLFASGCPAPSRFVPGRIIHTLPDAEFLSALKEYDGTPADVLGNSELMELMLPVLRRDFALNAEYRYVSERPLAVPISVLAGTTDPDIGKASLVHWGIETSAEFDLEWFPGGHFFIDQQRHAVLSSINAKLKGFLS